MDKDKEPLRKSKTPQGRLDMDDSETKAKDPLESKCILYDCALAVPVVHAILSMH